MKRWVFAALIIFTATFAASGSRPNMLVLISDDHSADDIGSDSTAPRTPALHALIKDGVRFINAYTVSPQCSPSRSSMVTGRSPHSTGTSRLHSALREEYPSIVDALREGGYYVGAFRKVHLGETFQSRWNFYGGDDVPFERFFQQRPKDHPFFLWVGFHEPHRPYHSERVNPQSKVRVPGFLPDTKEVRLDLEQYYDALTQMDAEIAKILAVLNTEHLSENTLVVFLGDNGMPFPGAKGTLYDAGVRVPLAFRWSGHIAPKQTRNDVVSLVDLAPTLLAVAKVPPLPRFEGRNLLSALTRDAALTEGPAFFERNWHDNLDFVRGIRSGRYLLRLQNYRPELPYVPTLDLGESPSWNAIQQLHRDHKLSATLEQRYFSSPRPEVELYDVEADPFQLRNLASGSGVAATVHSLQQLLSDWMVSTNDFLPPPIPPPRGEQGEPIH